ncbi:MAG: fumarylacetoacetate hydrolase family protein [Tissierellia bacterium]|nr:fumarylacetoacetate hydrolase family protein [Tissierellia bacterium]
MKYISFIKDGQHDFGILEDQKVYPLRQYLKDHFQLEGKDLRVLLQMEERIMTDDLTISYSFDEIKVEPPFLEGERNVLCIGKNYLDHVNEIKFLEERNDIPKEPIYFSKLVDQFKGPDDEIELWGLDNVDYEVELAIIIGKDGKNIPKERAKEYIFGYTIGNDLSARKLQMERQQWFKGKSLDGFCPIGPCIVTVDEFEFPPRRRITSKINGELRQDSYTDQLIFDIPTIIEDLSRNTTLKRGDIILTGTPSGVGGGFSKPKYIKKGDICTCEIEGIGILENKFI